jgi:hypothetical protein
MFINVAESIVIEGRAVELVVFVAPHASVRFDEARRIRPLDHVAVRVIFEADAPKIIAPIWTA